eukprot:767513-Hanusia_phi.AAC.1
MPSNGRASHQAVRANRPTDCDYIAPELPAPDFGNNLKDRRMSVTASDRTRSKSQPFSHGRVTPGHCPTAPMLTGVESRAVAYVSAR